VVPTTSGRHLSGSLVVLGGEPIADGKAAIDVVAMQQLHDPLAGVDLIRLSGA
jgi:hypothetical protein